MVELNRNTLIVTANVNGLNIRIKQTPDKRICENG